MEREWRCTDHITARDQDLDSAPPCWSEKIFFFFGDGLPCDTWRKNVLASESEACGELAVGAMLCHQFYVVGDNGVGKKQGGEELG